MKVTPLGGFDDNFRAVDVTGQHVDPLVERAQHPAGGRSVDIDLFAQPRIAGRNDEWLILHDEPDVADDRLVQDPEQPALEVHRQAPVLAHRLELDRDAGPSATIRPCSRSARAAGLGSTMIGMPVLMHGRYMPR